MKKVTLSLIAVIIIASACTKEVKAPVSKNADLIMRKRPRDPSLPPTPYLSKP